MSSLLERITALLADRSCWDAEPLAMRVVREIETTHRLIDPEDISDAMVEASFTALPEHYDPPDMSRRPWHALKARRRFAAMAKACKKISPD